jgi:preprotein translocase subunit YajC
MSLLISDAYAQGPAAPTGGDVMSQLLFLGVIFVLFYFLLIRPQVKRAKEHKKLTESLAKGDEVLTSGGVLGRITDVEEGFITVEIADNVRVKVQRNAVTSLLPKGTLKSAEK